MSDTKKQPAPPEKGDFPGQFRPAVIKDAESIQRLVKIYADKGEMLPRSLNELYETIRQYTVYEDGGEVVAACGLHISWKDLCEVRALAVEPDYLGRGIGSELIHRSLAEARRLGIPKVFALTYVPDFFKKKGFEEIDKSVFPHKIWNDCVRCHKFPDCDETGVLLVLDPDYTG